MKINIEIELEISGQAHTNELVQGAVNCAINGINKGISYVYADAEMKYMSEAKIISAKRVDAIVITNEISGKINKCLLKLQNGQIDWHEAKKWILKLCNPKFSKGE